MGSALPVTMSVSGMTGRWVWMEPRGILPAGVVLDHGDHNVMIAWATYAGGPARNMLVTLESLVPLTILEDVRCGVCGSTGRIVEGAWLPTEGGGS